MCVCCKFRFDGKYDASRKWYILLVVLSSFVLTCCLIFFFVCLTRYIEDRLYRSLFHFNRHLIIEQNSGPPIIFYQGTQQLCHVKHGTVEIEGKEDRQGAVKSEAGGGHGGRETRLQKN